MSDDIGYPVTTNRSGKANYETHGMSSLGRRNAKLDEAIGHEVRAIGRQHMRQAGTDDAERRIMNLFEGDVQKVYKLRDAIIDAVDASRRTHPTFIGACKDDHQISLRDQKERIEWCVWFAEMVRIDVHKSIFWICDNMTAALCAKLDDNFTTWFREKRKYWRSDKMGRALEGKG
jgi:hypothetical protein